MIKIKVSGIIEKVYAVKTLKTGYSQVVIVRQPKEEYKHSTFPEEFWVISTYSKNHTDDRFLKPEHERHEVHATVFVKGERWASANGEYHYSHKLNLQEWESLNKSHYASI